MKVLILGMGHVGKALARRLRDDGHQLNGTTTTAAKVSELEHYADKIYVLRGSDKDALAEAAQGCDAIIVTAAPNVRKTRTREEREEHYQEVLLASCRSAAAACERCVFLSSFSVYGDGGDGEEPITESTPVSNQDEPSAKYYYAAENAVLDETQGCALRFPDMYGAPGDMSFPERVKLAHQHFEGKTIFGADAPLYAIHFEDVIAAVIHALYENLTGVFNVCDNDNLPGTNQQVFDAICDAEGLSRLEFLNHIKAPNRKISAAKIYATGYAVKHADPNRHLLSEN
ncbi:MAG: NAD-dependent epimerase/dehydratase family protein [Pseudomonadales bacterium]